jgi:hypothetical protein
VAKGCNAVVYSARWSKSSLAKKEEKVAESSSIDITNSSPVDESSNSVLEDKESLTVQNVEVKTETRSDEKASENTKIEKATSEDAKADLPTNSAQNPNKAKKSGENTDDSVSWISEFITIYNL